MKAPDHLTEEAKEIWSFIVRTRKRDGLAPLNITTLESVAVLTSRLRDASARVEAEGLLIADAKGNPIAHPALEIERVTSEQLRKLMN